MSDLYEAVERAKTKGLWQKIMELREEVRFLRQQGDALVAENRHLREKLDRVAG